MLWGNSLESGKSSSPSLDVMWVELDVHPPPIRSTGVELDVFVSAVSSTTWNFLASVILWFYQLRSVSFLSVCATQLASLNFIFAVLQMLTFHSVKKSISVECSIPYEKKIRNKHFQPSLIKQKQYCRIYYSIINSSRNLWSK